MSVIRPVVKHEQERRGAFPGNPGNDSGLPIGNPVNYLPVRFLHL